MFSFCLNAFNLWVTWEYKNNNWVVVADNVKVLAKVSWGGELLLNIDLEWRFTKNCL